MNDKFCQVSKPSLNNPSNINSDVYMEDEKLWLTNSFKG